MKSQPIEGRGLGIGGSMKKIGRNALCPCGSGTKYKNCCLQNDANDLKTENALISALGHQKAGRLAQAAAICQQILDKTPDHAETLHLLGLIAGQMGNHERAVELINASIRVSPTDPAYHNNLGKVYGSVNMFDEAMECYRRALELDPEYDEVYSNMGIIRRGRGKFDEAVADFRKALAINPDFATAYYNLGVALKDQGKREEALASYRKAFDRSPDIVKLHNNSAVLLINQGKYDEAIEALQDLLAIKPDLPETLINLGNAFLKSTGKLDEAVTCYKKALEIRPDYAEACKYLGTAMKLQGRQDEAIDYYRKALHLKPDHVEMLHHLGSAYHDQGKLDEALKCFRRILRLEPDNESVLHIVSIINGQNPERSPNQFIVALFDQYADNFEAHLVQNLDYKIPEKLAALVVQLKENCLEKWDVLDLGCGTGLVGAAFAPHALRIVGVDLSSRMLARARATGLYERLEQEDIVPMMLREQAAAYDVVIAADVFIYIGRIDEIAREAKRMLRPGGLFAFSAEALEETPEETAAPADRVDYRVNRFTGRYSQSSAYIGKLAADNGFRIVTMETSNLRMERAAPVIGWLVAFVSV